MKNKGFALIAVIIGFIIISGMALLITNLISIESASLSIDKYYSVKSYYTAQAGYENAKRILSKVYKWYILKEGALENRSDNLDGASYETYISLPATVLRQNINKNTGSIPVFDTSRFPSSNILLLINEEQIMCSNKTPTLFTSCQRGYNGTSKDVHYAGDIVYPVAIISSVNSSSGTITVNNNQKFLTAGSLLIDSNPAFNNPIEVSYTDKTNNVFWGCDDLSWYSPGTYYVINSSLDFTEQVEIISQGYYKGISKKIVSAISR